MVLYLALSEGESHQGSNADMDRVTRVRAIHHEFNEKMIWTHRQRTQPQTPSL